VDQEHLRPYVPRLVQHWLAEAPEQRHRRVTGTALFADISGFTALTEALARRGKVGAEEMGDILNAVFGEVLSAAYDHGAGLVKWGGDAVLLLFDHEDHAGRAAAAAAGMQDAIARAGRVRTSGGVVQLGMSIGICTGELDFFLPGSIYRELIVTGPGASAVALMEKVADAGEVVISPATAAALAELGTGPVGPPKGDGVLLGAAAPRLEALPPRAFPAPTGVDLATALPPTIREHLEDGQVDAEHRHVTVGFIEFSGSDALVADGRIDELTDAVAELVDGCQQAAADNGVTILSTDLNVDGGKVILISGAPRRAGDDEARVLTAIRSVLDRGGLLSLRAGVTNGRVYAGDYGPEYRRNYSVAGDCVNLAARLMASAEPGQLRTTPGVLERTGGRFAAEPLPPFHVKGKRDPITALEVIGIVHERQRAGDATGPLVGRTAEMAELEDAAAALVSGRGRAIDLVGPGGIGKTRLVQELSQRTGLPTLWVDGDVYGDAAPFKPLRAFTRRQLDLAPDAPRAEVAARFEELVTAGAPHLVDWLPLLGPVVDADLPMTPVVADLDAEARKERMEWAVSELLGALIVDPSILVFNDAHLMDDATVDVLRRLTADARDRPWLVLTTYRPDERAVVAEGTSVLELGPLDERAAADLVAELSGERPLPAHQVSALVARAGGNPLYLGELVAAMATSADALELPDSIEGLISARIDRLVPAHRRLLRTAAVLGMDVDIPVLARVGAAVDELPHLSEFLAEADGGQVRFRHHLVRESAYEGLPFRRRAELHGRTAAAIEELAGPRAEERADLLSVHCFHGARYRDAWRYSVVAADRARAQYANAEAAEGFDRALAAARRVRDRGGLDLLGVRERLGDVAFELGEFDRARRALRAARDEASAGPVDRARICAKLAMVEESSTRYSTGLRWVTRGLQTLADIPGDAARRVEGELTTRRARLLHFQGRDREALRWAEVAVEQAEACGDDLTLAHALEYLDRCQVALGIVEAEPAAQRSLAIYEAAGQVAAQARIHNSLGMRAYFTGDWVLSLQHYRAAEEAYLRAGRGWGAATCQANIAEVLSDQGHLEEATDLLEQAMRVWRGIGAESEVTFGEYLLGRIDARSGRLDQALARYAAARGFCVAAGEEGEVQLIDALRAEALVLDGRAGDGLAEADRALAEALAAPGLVATIPLLHRIRGAALLATGDRDGAAAALRESVATARQREARHDLAMALDLLLAHGLERSSDEADGWRAELEELTARLGLRFGLAAR
jgi:class 3 adenylate cyclase/tetratricopeptide (TPR) repeat protein